MHTRYWRRIWSAENGSKNFRLRVPGTENFDSCSVYVQKRDGELVLLKCYEHTTKKPIFLKYFRCENGVASAQAEYDALLAYFVISGNGNRGVPQPLGVYCDARGGGIVALEWVGLPTAATWLHIGGAIPFIRRLVLCRCAGWLRWFHGAQEGYVRDLEHSIDLDRLALEVHMVEQRAAQLTSMLPHRRDHKATLWKAAKKCSSKVKHTRLHGDFWQKNVLLAPSRTVGLDFAHETIGPVFLDISKFLSHTAIQGYFPGNGDAGRCFLKDSATFFSAYSAEESSGVDAALHLFNVQALVDRAKDLSDKLEWQPAKKRQKRLNKLKRVISVLGEVLRNID